MILGVYPAAEAIATRGASVLVLVTAEAGAAAKGLVSF